MPTAATQTSKEFEFYLRTDLSEYRGKHIAIVGEQVVAADTDFKKVWAEAKQKCPDQTPLFAKVPTDDILILLIQ